MRDYGDNLGTAFQIVDDILDITATTEELGKTARKDVEAQKATYPAIWGLEASRHQAQRLISNAKAELEVFGDKAMPLIALADYITSRSN
jgi:geranylgeranyl diphosphate synthase type II